MERIRIPFQYHTGMLDDIRGFSDAKTAKEVVGRMKAAGCEVELHLYEDTPHSFLNALVPGGAGEAHRQIVFGLMFSWTWFHR